MTDRLKSFGEQELMIEYSSLRQPGHLPKGIYVALSGRTTSPRVLDGLLFLRSGPYRGACFKFQLSFGPDYPHKPPTIDFQSDVWHPLVSTTGKCVLSISTGSDGSTTTMVDTLYALKAAFKEAGLGAIVPEQVLNEECYQTLQHERPRFDELARQSARVSRSSSVLFDTRTDGEDDSQNSALRCLPQDEGVSYEEMMMGIRRYASAQGLI